MTSDIDRPDHFDTPFVLGAFDRRRLMKIGAGAALAPMLGTAGASAQAAKPQQPVNAAEPTVNKTGWKNDASRISGNGPMDDTSRRIVHYVSSFSESDISDAVADAAGNTLLDTMSALIAGFETEPIRIGARMAKTMRSDLKSTVLGYGITTTPEMAAFVNGCMMRYADFNDVNTGGHFSDMIMGVLAVAEAVHATGAQTLAAVTLAYEVAGAMTRAGSSSRGWDSPFELPAIAVAAGKLMNLNEDQLANALSLALVAHMPMSAAHEGPLSMWKSCHAPEASRCAVFSALLAQAGMTGPAEPFQSKGALFDHIGTFTKFALPTTSLDGRMVIQRANYKRSPAEASMQSILELVPEIRAWSKPEDITAIEIQLAPGWLQEIADPSKWDPRNHETADHSIPYVLARCLLDGEIYLDSYSEEKFMDPAARRLMDVTTARANTTTRYNNEALSLDGQIHLTFRNKSGGELVKETTVAYKKPMTRAELVAKFDRVCAYRKMPDEQRDLVKKQWLNLREVKDIAEAMQTLAKFGQPQAL
jgi:2-methylcitrate dehydratase